MKNDEIKLNLKLARVNALQKKSESIETKEVILKAILIVMCGIFGCIGLIWPTIIALGIYACADVGSSVIRKRHKSEIASLRKEIEEEGLKKELCKVVEGEKNIEGLTKEIAKELLELIENTEKIKKGLEKGNIEELMKEMIATKIIEQRKNREELVKDVTDRVAKKLLEKVEVEKVKEMIKNGSIEEMIKEEVEENKNKEQVTKEKVEENKNKEDIVEEVIEEVITEEVEVDRENNENNVALSKSQLALVEEKTREAAREVSRGDALETSVKGEIRLQDGTTVEIIDRIYNI